MNSVWKRELSFVLAGGAIAGVGPLLVASCAGPTPGGMCGLASGGVSLAYLCGVLGGALVVGGLWRHIAVHRSVNSAGDTLVAGIFSALGMGLLILGYSFTCGVSLSSSGGVCYVGPLPALIAYSFGTLGAALATTGILGFRLWRKQTSATDGLQSDLAKRGP